VAETIAVTGEPYLPDWCRGEPAVVELAKRDLAYRCDLWRAKAPMVRRLLAALAHYTQEKRR
jgi:hypothetical protein